MTAPEEVPQQWTPWVTIVCQRRSCGKRVTRAWPPGTPVAPRYCSKVCSRKAGNSRNKSSRRRRAATGGEIGVRTQVWVTCVHCTRQRVVGWTTNEPEPRFCSAYCGRQFAEQERRERRAAEIAALCEHPEKLAYKPTEHGIRKAASDAVKFEKYVYPCRCMRFHLTSATEQGAPLGAVDIRRPRAERRAAWYGYLAPIGQELRERHLRAISARVIQAAQGRS